MAKDPMVRMAEPFFCGTGCNHKETGHYHAAPPAITWFCLDLPPSMSTPSLQMPGDACDAPCASQTRIVREPIRWFVVLGDELSHQGHDFVRGSCGPGRRSAHRKPKKVGPEDDGASDSDALSLARRKSWRG